MEKKPVLFASLRPYSRSENLQAIYHAYNGQKKWMEKADRNFESTVKSGIYDVMVTDDFPQIAPKKCIMVWHGIQGGKKIGLDQPGRPYYKPYMADNMNYIITPGHGTVKIYADCSGVPEENVLPLGMPRTDAYICKKKGDGNTTLQYKRAYLYVPTFRETSETRMPDIDWAWIDSQLTDDELFVVKAHPVTRRLRIGEYRHIIEVNGYEPSAPYLIDADVIVTDYSSIMFDGYLLGKPAVLFEKKPGYTETRGMYLEYPDQYCSRYARNEEELLDYIRSATQLSQTEIDCRDLVADMCDGHSCERICKLIDEINKGE